MDLRKKQLFCRSKFELRISYFYMIESFRNLNGRSLKISLSKKLFCDIFRESLKLDFSLMSAKRLLLFLFTKTFEEFFPSLDSLPRIISPRNFDRAICVHAGALRVSASACLATSWRCAIVFIHEHIQTNQ